ncbi:tyrosinase precursor [Cordyceps javanica]|uniref:tyrosinase n=1 Tax=Cordyceps javanica TaxID=43265 RepID=A0A545UYE5_9HYPO|nr:tyrosinase precursor [Cordyceps javanica]TQW06374.1 tyrosinase precursor [Cordyceps javanica]
MHGRDPTHPESFFQIAGIHGRPFMPYNNAGPANTTSWQGYSPHAEALFLIWHRPFVALFEQVIVKEAKALAAAYPEELRLTYLKAAENLCMPYWDWALHQRLPQVVVSEKIEIKVPTKDGMSTEMIANPLYTYKFPEEVKQGKFGEFNATAGHSLGCASSAVTNANLLGVDYKRSLYKLYSESPDFRHFSTTASNGTSLEAVHDWVHWHVSCGGQFLETEYSAFNTMFMLHHANVDRLWAYWQAMHPDDSTIGSSYPSPGSFSVPKGTPIDIDSPLYPFRQISGDGHTPRTVNNIATFGYTYERLEYWHMSEEQLKHAAIQVINSLYGPDGTGKLPEPEQSASKPISSKTSTQIVSTQSTQSQSTQSQSGKISAPAPTSQPTASSGNVTVGSATNSSSPTSIAVSSVLPSVAVSPSSVSAGMASQPSLVNSEMQSEYKSISIGLSVEVTRLPVRPCILEISIGNQRVGGMPVMKMPEEGIVHSSISIDENIMAELGDIAHVELASKIAAQLRVTLVKVDKSTIDVSQLSGIVINVEETEMVAPTSNFELPQAVNTSSFVVMEKPILGCVRVE